MATTFTDQIGSGATSATITSAATLASSATVGAQSAAITLLDGNNNVPQAIDVELGFTNNSTALANDKTVYLFAARSLDGTNFEDGPPAVSGSDASFTFTSSPVGTSPLPTGLYFVGAITCNSISETRRKMFRLFSPPAKLSFIVLNYSGGTFTACAVKYRARSVDGR